MYTSEPHLLLIVAIVLLSLYSLIPISESSSSNPTTSADRISGTEYLDSEQKYLLSWNISSDEAVIYFEVTAETKGFVGFGISPNGGMTGADLLIAGVYANGSTYGSDYHGVGNTRPVEDVQSDWIVTRGSESENHTTIKFHRLLNTCDNEDFQITDGTSRVIWALGETDNVGYHGSTNRGTKSVNFYIQDEQEFESEKYKNLDFMVTMEMPHQHTSYWCTIHKAPVFDDKQHIVAFDAVLENTPALQHTHHFIVYRCVAPTDENPEDIFDEWVDHPGEHCFAPSNASFPFAQYCSRFAIYIWSKGGKGLVFPPDMGLPMPETPGRREYYALEVHYDNPDVITGLEFKTGARMYYTSETRDTEVGLLLMNHNVVPQLAVPPNVTDYIVTGHCSGECTDKFLPEDGITIFNNLFHAHVAGRKLKLRQFREGKELPWVDVDEYYDFDFQQNKQLTSPRKVEKGDQLTVECTYDSTTAEGGRAVVGGLSTYEEMCEAIVYYYPRQEFFYCGSEQNLDDHFKLLGMTNYTRKENEYTGGYPEYEILEPEELAGSYIDSLSFKVNWTDEFREKFQREKRFGEQIAMCNAGLEHHKGKVAYPENLTDYVPPNDCHSQGHGSGTRTTAVSGVIKILLAAFALNYFYL